MLYFYDKNFEKANHKNVFLVCNMSYVGIVTIYLLRGRKEMFYLMMHSTHFIYVYMERKGNVLFNDTQHILFMVIW